MDITHVIRGEEWVSSLPIHSLLYESFEWNPPEFFHLPLLLNKDKSKLSKRQGDVAVEDFLKKGYLPDCLINFVALLGWHPKDNNEIFSLKELINKFSLDRINKSGAVFDIEKLNWMNGKYLQSLPNEQIFNLIINETNKYSILNKKQMFKMIEYSKNRSQTIQDILSDIEMFVTPPNINSLELKQYNYKDIFKLLSIKLHKKDNEKYTKDIINEIGLELNIKGANLFCPLRYALIGLMHGADIPTIINILGIEETLNRLNNEI